MASAFKVLAVDGGGIRGLIPAFILAAIEEQTGHPIHESFDLIAGTSTGGIIALGLTKPNASGGADKSARDLTGSTKTRAERSSPRRSCRACTSAPSAAPSTPPAASRVR